MTRKPLLVPVVLFFFAFSLIPAATGTDIPKIAGQALSETPSAKPLFAPTIPSVVRPPLQPAVASPQNASIVSPIPPPSPTSPSTFKNGAIVPIAGVAAGAGFQSFQVDWAPGLDAASGWVTTGVTLIGGGSAPITNSLLATWDTTSVTTAGYYTIRLTVNISNAPVQALTMVYLEPDLLSAGWPQFFPLGAALGASVVPARNTDGTFRLLLETPAGPGFTTGQFWTLSLNAPAQVTDHASNGSFTQPAVANFNGGPGDESMVTDFITGTPVASNLELFQQNGTFTSLASNPNLWGVGSQLVVEDLAGDSHWETVGYGIDYTNEVADISAWNSDGTLFSSKFPVQVPFQSQTDGRLNRNTVLVGDLNGDGQKEIVAMEDLTPTTFSLALFASDGSPLTWQVPALPGTPVVMAAADLDNNGKLETIIAANSDTQTFLHVFQPDGTERPGWPLTLFNSNMASQSYLAVGDLNHNGQKEIVYAHESYLYVFNADASNFSNAWPIQTLPANENLGYGAVAIGDVDGDGFPEIVTVLSTLTSTNDPYFSPDQYVNEQLVAIRRDGTTSKSWQLNAGSGCWLEFFPAPAIGDFNQDGITDIAVASSIGAGACSASTPGIVTIISTGATFNPSLNDWPLTRHDPRQTSVLLCSDLCLSASAPQTVDAGSPASYTITVTPNEIPYNAPVGSFACSGLPTGAACNFSQSSVTPGLSPATTMLTISTTSRTLAAMAQPAAASQRLLFAALLAPGLLGTILIFAAPNKRPRATTAATFTLLLVVSTLAVSCGGSGSAGPQPNPNGTPAGAYTVTVSATGGSNILKTVKLTLTVN
jgi:FG-GAP-like repeat